MKQNETNQLGGGNKVGDLRLDECQSMNVTAPPGKDAEGSCLPLSTIQSHTLMSLMSLSDLGVHYQLTRNRQRDGMGEMTQMAQWLGTLSATARDSALIPSMYTRGLTTACDTRSDTLFWLSRATGERID